MSKTTRATQMLTKAGIVFSAVTYDYDPNAERIGLQAAQAIGAEPDLVLKAHGRSGRQGGLRGRTIRPRGEHEETGGGLWR